MSYDIWLEQPACVSCGRGDETVGDWNYTSNCAPMWRRAGADLAKFHGHVAGDCTRPLRAAIASMVKEPEGFIAMNPENGWGSYASLIPALRTLLLSFQTNPRAVVRVSR